LIRLLSGLGLLAAAAIRTAAAAPGPPPPELGLDPFYAKCVIEDGIPVVASERTSDEAVLAAAAIVRGMLTPLPDVCHALRDAKIRVAVIAAGEQTTDIPEYRDLRPKARWDERTRGLGATLERPVVSSGEENLLGLDGDRYEGESILVHELAHAVHEIGLADSDFQKRLDALYARAMENGLWKRTYAARDVKEYWAEGVQSFFDANLRSVAPNGIHNHVWSRKTLEAYDPDLAALVREIFGGTSWRWKRLPHVAARTSQTWLVRVEGSDKFTQAVGAALDLLKSKSPRTYQSVDAYVGLIREARRTGMRAFKKPPTFEIAEPTWTQPAVWLASVIAHDAHHSKLYHDFKRKNADHVPDEAWTGREAELKCLSVQIKALEDLAAPQKYLDYCRSLDGTHTDGSRDSYKARNW